MIHDVLELRLVRPIEVCWERPYPMPVITLRRPDMVKYDSETRLVHVDTGKGLVLLPLDAESVDRMALAPAPLPLDKQGAYPPSPSPASASPGAERSEPPNSTVRPSGSTGTVLIRKKG